MHIVPSCHHLHLTDAYCVQYHLASALWVFTAQSLAYFFSTLCSRFCVSGVCFLLLTSDDGCRKQFLLPQDLFLTSLTLTLVAALPLIKVGLGVVPNVFMACFLQPVVLGPYPS